MKRIVKGNDFTLRIPVAKVVEGEKVAFPLPACTDVAVRIANQYKRVSLDFSIDTAEDNVILAKVEGDQISLGTYAVEVRGKIFGSDWRSNEYPQFQIVGNNADADTEFGTTDEGDDSVEMDTALVVLPPAAELSQLIGDTNEALKTAKATDETLTANEAARQAAETSRVEAEQARATAETSRKSNESDRQTAETDRAATFATLKSDMQSSFASLSSGMKTATDNAQKAADESNATNTAVKAEEEKRALAETSRATAEKQRATEEGIRQEAETERIRQETARQSAETSRTEAEEARASAEASRESTLAKTKADCETATKAAADVAATVEDVVREAKVQLAGLEIQSVQAEAVEMEAGKYYDITLATSNILTLSLQAISDTTHAHDYEGGFTADTNTAPTVTWPEGVTWADMPTLKAGMHYEFSIRQVGEKKYGVIYVW